MTLRPYRRDRAAESPDPAAGVGHHALWPASDRSDIEDAKVYVPARTHDADLPGRILATEGFEPLEVGRYPMNLPAASLFQLLEDERALADMAGITGITSAMRGVDMARPGGDYSAEALVKRREDGSLEVLSIKTTKPKPQVSDVD